MPKNICKNYVISNHKYLLGLGHLHSDKENHPQEHIPEDWQLFLNRSLLG